MAIDYGNIRVGDLAIVLSVNFSDLQSVDWNEVRSYLSQSGYYTSEVASVISMFESGDFSLLFKGIEEVQRLVDTYPPDTLLSSIYGGGEDGGGGTTEPGGDLGGLVNIDDALFNLNEKLQFIKSQASQAIESVLYDLKENGTWLAENLGLPTTVEGVKGELRDQLFDQIGATATEQLLDHLEDKLGRFGEKLGEAKELIQSSLSVKKIVSEFIGNLFDNLEAGMDSISGKNDLTLDEYESRVDGSVGKFRDDARDWMKEKHGEAGALITDILSGRVFGIQEVNSFKAVIYDDDAVVTGGAKHDVIYGSKFADKIKLSAGGDIILAGAGDDTIYFDANYGGSRISGGGGLDTMVFSVASDDYFYKRDQIGPHLTGPGGRMELDSVDRLVFTNGTVAADTQKGENAGMAYRLYQAAFDRTPDSGGLKFWIGQFDDGRSIARIAEGFLGSQEAIQVYGANPGADNFVRKLYIHVLDREGESGGINFWLGQMSSGMSRADVLANFSESAENIATVSAAIDNGIWLS